MLLILTRYGSTPYGAFGELQAGDQVFYTIEQEWNDNRKGQSCVPLGEYRMLWRPTTTSVPDSYDEHSWYLEGATVSADHESDKPRTRCCFHIGNTAKNFHGCIGVGLSLTQLIGMWAIGSSRKAMDMLINEVHAGDHYLLIKQGDCG